MWYIILYLSITGLSALAAILAWIAKIRWSNEYRLAKEAQIESLKQQIENLKELTPDKIHRYYINMKEMYSENIDQMDKELGEAKHIISLKQKQIEELEFDKEANKNKIQELIIEKDDLITQVSDLELSVEELRKKEKEGMFIPIHQQIESMIEQANKFAKEQKDIASRISELSKIKVDSDWLLHKHFPKQKKDTDK